MKQTEHAYAKINLYLNVIARRNDGFHDIESVMQTVDLADILHFELFPSKHTEVKLSFSSPCNLPADERNLIVKAALAFLNACGETARVSIKLEKHIPMAAGLAGGSADAAATLRALDSLLPGRLTKAAITEIAAALGSDVPFCLIGGRALCYGRGEETVPLPIAQRRYGVLANTDETSSTPKAYSALDAIYHNFDKSVMLPTDLNARGALQDVLRGELPPAFNIFEDAVLPLCPRACAAKALLLRMGAQTVLMSGSGPSVFALTDNHALCKRMEASLTRCGYRARTFSF